MKSSERDEGPNDNFKMSLLRNFNLNSSKPRTPSIFFDSRNCRTAYITIYVRTEVLCFWSLMLYSFEDGATSGVGLVVMASPAADAKSTGCVLRFSSAAPWTTPPSNTAGVFIGALRH